MTRAQRVLAPWLALLLLVAGCRSSASFTWEQRPGPYDQLGGNALASLSQARASFAAGDRERARQLVLEIWERFPDNIPVGAFLQELQMELLVESPAGDDDEQAPAERRRRLARLWRSRAEEEPTAAHLVLAARIEDDGPAARILLESALEVDPQCGWAFLGLAHLNARQGRWNDASQRLRDTFRVDPGLPQARRLQASVLARSGSPERAISALEHWLKQVGSDPRVAPELVDSAYLDLAQLRIERGNAKRAAKVLEAAGGRQLDERRRLLLLAAIEQELGRPDRALQAAIAAEELDPSDPIPLEQQAMLYDLWLDDPIAAQHAWLRLQDRSTADLAGRLRVMRAQIELERLQAELEGRPQPGFGDLEQLPGRRRPARDPRDPGDPGRADADGAVGS